MADLIHAYFVEPAAVRDDVLAEGIVASAETGKIWLYDTEELARRLAGAFRDQWVDTLEGIADVWLVDMAGIDAEAPVRQRRRERDRRPGGCDRPRSADADHDDLSGASPADRAEHHFDDGCNGAWDGRRSIRPDPLFGVRADRPPSYQCELRRRSRSQVPR